MKKLAIAAIGLGLVLSTVSFSQNTDSTQKKTTRKKKSKKTDDGSTK